MGNHRVGRQEIVWTRWCKCRSESRVVTAAALPGCRNLWPHQERGEGLVIGLNWSDINAFFRRSKELKQCWQRARNKMVVHYWSVAVVSYFPPPHGLFLTRLPVHGIFPRQNYWSELPFPSKVSSWLTDRSHVSYFGGPVLHCWDAREACPIKYLMLLFLGDSQRYST